MIDVYIDVVVRFRPKLLDGLSAKPAGVFSFANKWGLWPLCNKRPISRSWFKEQPTFGQN
jgi:hypothetical protein